MRQLASETGISLGTVRNILKTLEMSTEICTVHEGKNNRDLSIISITNYDKYQSYSDESKQQSEQLVNSKCTVNEQQVNNSKKEKNAKKEKKEKKLNNTPAPAKKGAASGDDRDQPPLPPGTGGFDINKLIEIYPGFKHPIPNKLDLIKIIKNQKQYDLVLRGIESYKIHTQAWEKRFIKVMGNFIKERLWEQYADDPDLSSMVNADNFLKECIARQEAYNASLDEQGYPIESK